MSLFSDLSRVPKYAARSHLASRALASRYKTKPEVAYDPQSWPYGASSRDHRDATTKLSSGHLRERKGLRQARCPSSSPTSQPRDAEAAVGAMRRYCAR